MLLSLSLRLQAMSAKSAKAIATKTGEAFADHYRDRENSDALALAHMNLALSRNIRAKRILVNFGIAEDRNHLNPLDIAAKEIKQLLRGSHGILSREGVDDELKVPTANRFNHHNDT